MNELTLFEKGNWKIRTVIRDGEPWFVARDVCAALDIGNVSDAIFRLDEDEKGFDSIDTLGGKQQVAFVTEPGLYSLALGSRKPDAKEFKRWITHDVIPSIRKHGMYATPATVEAMLADPATAIKMLTAYKESQEQLAEANQKLQIAAPKVEGYDKLMSSNDCISIGDMAKLLKTGQNRLFRFLRFKRVLMEDNIPYQPHIDAGRFRVIEQPWGLAGDRHIGFKTLVTPKGQEYIRKVWETLGIEAQV